MGEYYVEYIYEELMWGVFHTSDDESFISWCYGMYTTKKEAEHYAAEWNKVDI